MEYVPFFALHGVKVMVALVVFAAGYGVFLYLRGPARRARRRRAEIRLPPPTPLDRLAPGSLVTLEGTLVASETLEVGDRAAVACGALHPGREDEGRKTAAAGPLALEVGEARVSLEGAFDLRAGSRELYPRVALAYGTGLSEKALQAAFGEDFDPVVPSALFEVKDGERVRAYGRVEAAASGRSSGYREAKSDWRMGGGDGDQVVLWYPDKPRIRGNTPAGIVWRAVWVGALAFAALIGGARLSDELFHKVDDPAVRMRLADVIALDPWGRDRASWRYAHALRSFPPTRERGRAIAGLHELRGFCDDAAEELYSRQDLDEAIAVAERCPAEAADRIVVASLLLQGKIDQAARRAVDVTWATRGQPLALLLHAGLWREARARVSGFTWMDEASRACLDGWLAAKLNEPVPGEELWGRSDACALLRADQLSGRERLELLARRSRWGHRHHEVRLLLELEARQELEATAGGEDMDPGAADEGMDSPEYDVQRHTQRVAEEASQLLTKVRFYRSYPGYGFLDRLGQPGADSQEGVRWRLAPPMMARALLEGLRGEREQARALADRSRGLLAGVREALRAHGRDEPDDWSDVLDFALALLAGEAPPRGAMRLGESAFVVRELLDLASWRRSCAAKEPLAPGRAIGFELSGALEGVCQAPPGALLEGRLDEVDPQTLHAVLLAIAPVIGEAPGLAEGLSAAPLLAGRNPARSVLEAYAVATHSGLIYDELGHAELAARWKERSLVLQGVLRAREPAAPLALLRTAAPL